MVNNIKEDPITQVFLLLDLLLKLFDLHHAPYECDDGGYRQGASYNHWDANKYHVQCVHQYNSLGLMLGLVSLRETHQPRWR